MRLAAFVVAAAALPGGAGFAAAPLHFAPPRPLLRRPALAMHGGGEPSEGGILASVGESVNKVKDFWHSVERHATHPRFEGKIATYREASKVTLLGTAVNIFLAAFKGFAGVYGHSAAMVCDAMHSASDLVSDGLTLIALRLGAIPPDLDHPYGHGRFESIGSLAIGVLLMLTSASFGSMALAAIRAPSDQGPRMIALVAALVSVLSKEALFVVTMRVGTRLNSQIIMANAWHHRSDALSSVVAIVGIAAALASPAFRIFDPLCGVAVAGLVGWMGIQVMMESLFHSP
jgi:divalent metal cation (Fe/Co/Zn/Cd) transporter